MNGRPRLDGQLQVIVVLGHVEAVENAAQLLQIETAGGMPLAACVALNDVDVGELIRIDPLDQRQIDRLGV